MLVVLEAFHVQAGKWLNGNQGVVKAGIFAGIVMVYSLSWNGLSAKVVAHPRGASLRVITSQYRYVQGQA